MKFPAYRSNQQKLMPPGQYEFEISDLPEFRQGRRGGGYFILKLEIIFKDGSRRKFNTILTPWEKEYGNFLRVLGGRRDDHGDLELDDSDLLGKQFKGEIVRVENPNNSSIIWEKLKNISERGTDEGLY